MLLSALLAGLLSLAACPDARATLQVNFSWNTGNFNVVDGGAGDTDGLVNGSISLTTLNLGNNQITPGAIVQYDPLATTNMSTIFGGGPVTAIKLTNFIAEATSATPDQLRIVFMDQLTGSFTGYSGGDQIDPFVGTAGPAVPAGQDEMQRWQGFLDVLVFPPPFGPAPPIGNPAIGVNGFAAYPIYGHGPFALPGTFVNPIMGGELYFQLGGLGDRFVLQTSAEVGIGIVVPEPTSFISFGCGLIGLIAIARRRAKR